MCDERQVLPGRLHHDELLTDDHGHVGVVNDVGYLPGGA
jgi:hypothetical protein